MTLNLEEILKKRVQSSDFLLIQKSFSNLPFAKQLTSVPEDVEQVQFKVGKAVESSIKLDKAKKERNNYCSFSADYSVKGNFIFYKILNNIPLISEDVNFTIRYQGFIDPENGSVIESGVFKI